MRLNEYSNETAFYDVLFINQQDEDAPLNNYEAEILQNVKLIIDQGEINSSIPKLPGVFSEILSELNKEHTDFEKIAIILKKDPILAAKVLTLVNSAYYKRTKQDIDDLGRAVSLLGLNTISFIFVSLIVKQLTKMDVVHYNLFGKLIWQHSLETAYIGEMLSKHFSANSTFLCYLLGLVHDLGKVFIFKIMSEQWQRQIQLNHLGSKPFKVELTALSNKLSLLISQEWQLPEVLSNAIENHMKGIKDEPYSKVLYVANKVSELHLQNQENIINIKTANDRLLKLGLSFELANECLAEVINVPPI